MVEFVLELHLHLKTFQPTGIYRALEIDMLYDF